MVIWRHTYGERGNPQPPLHGLLFPISSNGPFISTIPHTGYHIPRSLLHQSWSTGWNEKHVLKQILKSSKRQALNLNRGVVASSHRRERKFYLTTHSTQFIYGYMASDIWLRTILIMRKETRCRHIGYSYRLTARVILYAPSHIQDNTYHGLCYTSRGALAETRNSSMGSPYEGSIRQPIAPWANAQPLSYVPLLQSQDCCSVV